jgi:hypothetical protein
MDAKKRLMEKFKNLRRVLKKKHGSGISPT